MKLRLWSSVALASSLALLLFSVSDSAAQGPPRRRLVADTGMVTLGPNQMLRLSIASRTGPFADGVVLEFVQVAYGEGTCSGGVCTHPVLSRSTSGPVTLGPGQGASLEIANSAFGVRGLVLSNDRDVRALAEIIDGTSNTLQIIAVLIGL